MQSLSCLKRTSDCWYPNHEEHFVHVFFFNKTQEGEPNRVALSGDDDFGLVYDGEDAEYIFMRILEMDDVTVKKAQQLGMKGDL
jgi:hypothetical protein